MTALLTAQLCDTKAVATTLQIFKLVYILFSKCSHAVRLRLYMCSYKFLSMSDCLLFNKILCLYQGLNNNECEKTLMWCFFFLSCYCLMIHTLNMIVTFSTNTIYCLCHTQYLTKIIENLYSKLKTLRCYKELRSFYSILTFWKFLSLWEFEEHHT